MACRAEARACALMRRVVVGVAEERGRAGKEDMARGMRRAGEVGGPNVRGEQSAQGVWPREGRARRKVVGTRNRKENRACLGWDGGSDGGGQCGRPWPEAEDVA